jgi:hypothetical protein
MQAEIALVSVVSVSNPARQLLIHVSSFEVCAHGDGMLIVLFISASISPLAVLSSGTNCAWYSRVLFEGNILVALGNLDM